MSESAPLAEASPATPRATYALGLLCVVYLLNFLDRTLIFVLFPPIKAELHFTDTQLALLGSTSFVLFYTVLGIPFGRLADRVSRTRMIAVGLAVWSLFSGLTGFADSFATLFFCRVMVGVGEATLGPAAMSLLSDLFPPHRRATVQSIYSAGIPLGAAAAIFLGGHIGGEWGWRTAFYVLGFPGLLLAGLVLALAEPPRGRTEAAGAAEAAPDWRVLLRSIPLRYHIAGYALMAVAGNSLSIWLPSLLARHWQMPLSDIGNFGGFATALSGGLATAFGGAGADVLRRKDRGGRLRFSLILALICAPLWILLLWSPALIGVKLAWFLLAGFGLAWLGPAAADVHDIVGPKLRGLGIAVYFCFVNIVGYGVAPLIVGALNDRMGVAADPGLMRSILLLCPAACLLAALCFFIGSRKLAAEPHRA